MDRPWPRTYGHDTRPGVRRRVADSITLLSVTGQPARAASAERAALQAALKSNGLYPIAVDGVRGPVHGPRCAPLPATARADRRRHRRPADPARTRASRAPSPRLARDLAGRPRLGRRRAAVLALAPGLLAGRRRHDLRPGDTFRACSATSRPPVWSPTGWRGPRRSAACAAASRSPTVPVSTRADQLLPAGAGTDRRRIRGAARERPPAFGRRLPGRARHARRGGRRRHHDLRRP